MSRNTEYKHPLRLETPTLMQDEFRTPVSVNIDDMAAQVLEKEAEMQRLQKDREALAEKMKIQVELEGRRQVFEDGRLELGAKISRALTSLDHELVDFRLELDELEETKICFTSHKAALDKFDFDQANPEQIVGMLDRGKAALDIAEDEFDSAVHYFTTKKKRSAPIFQEFARGSASKSVAAKPAFAASMSEFWAEFRRGFAFNLPLLIVACLALITWLVKG